MDVRHMGHHEEEKERLLQKIAAPESLVGGGATDTCGLPQFILVVLFVVVMILFLLEV